MCSGVQKETMQKSIMRTWNSRNKAWLVLYAFVCWVALLWFNIFFRDDGLGGFRRVAPILFSKKDVCSGRYIYVHDLPSKFNHDLLEKCHSLIKYWDMCPYVKNHGLGPPVNNSRGVFTNKNWYATNQFALEIIFHNKMMNNYDCLTDDSSLASAIFVPYYAGLDIGRHLWGFNMSIRDSLSLDIAKWLREKPEWKKLWGRDHFLIGGRIAWDFRRYVDNESEWGSKLMALPEGKNMTMLSIEGSCWNNDFAIPYPTYFHPSSDSELYEWQEKMRRQQRKHLFSFIGAPRPGMQNSIRGQLIEQCQASGNCKLLDCNKNDGAVSACKNPVNIMKTFQESVFCLQPSGDSFTRKSAFDSILAGCIPVFFHPGNAYVQYTWHLPKNHTSYSVFISEKDVEARKVIINDVLVRYSKEEIHAMREEIIKLIPRILYSHPRRPQSKTFDDAFDITIKAVLERVRKIRMQFIEGKTEGVDLSEDGSWRNKISAAGFGTMWNSFF